ncbi:MAG: hypothetical protein ACRDNK_18345 [Solirubrobacteraceae bacterium]
MVIACVATLALLVAGAPGTAQADGDPASDVLTSQSLFLPQDSRASVRQQAELSALLVEAQRRRFPLRVAIIASRADLGSVGELWRRPQSYARFLGQELSLVYHGSLLVAMPNGFGFVTSGAQSVAPATSGARPPGALLPAASVAEIQHLAAAAGHPLSVATVDVPVGSRSADLTAWAVFAIGAVLIAAAWIASLRARPLSLRAPR